MLGSLRFIVVQLRKFSLLVQRGSFHRELDEEMAFHCAEAQREFEARGMSPESARRAALRQFGNISRIQERSHEQVHFSFEYALQDIRFALRQLRRNPAFSVTAMLVLALGIGSSVAIFGFVDAALIKPLPYQQPSRLVGLYESNTMGPTFHLSYLDYLDWKKQNHVFSSLNTYDATAFLLNTPSGVQHVDGASVSDGFFTTVGIKPVLGRSFLPGEDLPSAPRTVLLSYSAWQNRYGGRTDALGQAILLDKQQYIIVGVLPEDFHFAPVEAAEFWTTFHFSLAEDRGEHGISGIARLKDGVTLATAQSEMSRIAAQIAKQYPDADQGRGATILPLSEVIVGNIRPILLMLLCGSGLLLLIACVNVASLLVVRSVSRKREIAVRRALGASRLRLLRQLATEGLLLVTGSTLLGLGSAYLGMRLLLRLIPAQIRAGMPYLQGLSLNFRVLAFAALIALAAAVLFSVAPAIWLSVAARRSTNLQADLADGGRGAAGARWHRLGSNLVIVELVMAAVLLSGAGLLGKSLYRLLHTELGLTPDHLATLRVSLPTATYAQDPQRVALGQAIVQNLGSLPGVESVGLSRGLPLGGGGGSTTFEIIGRPPTTQMMEVNLRQIDPGYLTALGARMLRGRAFTTNDDQQHPPVMIVNDAMARKYFPGEDPLGKRIRFDASSPAKEIVGIVVDIKEGPLDKATMPVMYDAFNQEPEASFFVVVRTRLDEDAVLSTLATAIHHIDPNIGTFQESTMRTRLQDSSAAYLHRAAAWLVGGFAAIALVLGVVGLYGVIAYSVSQRTREIGVRIALGATRGSVYQLILLEAGRLIAAGLALGLVSSVAAATLMRKLLFGTAVWDIATLAGVTILLGGAAMAASYLPARRAARVNPMVALRRE